MEEDEDASDDEDKEGFLLDDQNDPAPIQANEDIYEDYTDPSWQPAANDAEPGACDLWLPVQEYSNSFCMSGFRVQKTSDIISTLVSIFGSKDLFIKELQISFGQRLLAITDGNYGEEVRPFRFIRLQRPYKEYF